MGSILLAQITDTHLFEHEEGALLTEYVTASTFRAVLDHISAQATRPDMLLVTGDLSEDGSVESYRRLDQSLCDLGIPYYWIPGNHDNLGNMTVELPETPFHFVHEGWGFALLNSKRLPDGDDGEVRVEELDSLSQVLETDPRPTLVALHHPPIRVGSPWIDDRCILSNSDALRRTLGGHAHVKVVTFGHAHQEFDQVIDGIRYLGTPSTCVQVVPRKNEFTVDTVPPGYRLLRLHDDGSVDTEVVRVKPAESAPARA